jgi:platelet-activating factor acetylhydrolase
MPLKGKEGDLNWPLVLFSHGLTGSGEENAYMCASLARQGAVVACVHHTDGSSNAVKLGDGGSSTLFYQHPPGWVGDPNHSNQTYDIDFRPKQIAKRVENMSEARKFLLYSKKPPNNNGNNTSTSDGVTREQWEIVLQLQDRLSADRVCVAGFSYGGATSSLCAVMEPSAFSSCIVLDGWFNITWKAKGVALDWPKAVHEQGIQGLPSLFINTQEFSENNIKEPTDRIIEKSSDAQRIVLPGTTHWNFQESVFWLPERLLRRFSLIGTSPSSEVYHQVVESMWQFIAVHNFVDQQRPEEEDRR